MSDPILRMRVARAFLVAYRAREKKMRLQKELEDARIANSVCGCNFCYEKWAHLLLRLHRWEMLESKAWTRAWELKSAATGNEYGE